MEEWIISLDVSNFEALKELIVVTDLVNQRSAIEMKKYSISDLPKIKNADAFLSKLDDFGIKRLYVKIMNRNYHQFDDRKSKNSEKSNSKPWLLVQIFDALRKQQLIGNTAIVNYFF